MISIRSTLVVLGILFTGNAFADSSASLQDYSTNAAALVARLETLRDNARSCGFIGGMIAGRMPGAINDQKAQMRTVGAAAKKGPAGRPIIEDEIQKAEEGNQELLSNERMVHNGLSSNHPNCIKALGAFDRMKFFSLQAPAKMRRLRDDL